MTRSTHRSRVRDLLLAALCVFCFSFHIEAVAQSTNEAEKNEPQFFSNINAGFGMLYGGFGGSLEGGIGHFGGYAALGYATKRSIDTITINPSFNYQLGLRYYFDVGSDALFPRIGLGYGWITNYYNDNIGNDAYDAHVHGLSVHIGAQFYSSEGVVFNFDVGMGSKFSILNPEDHPFFYPLYVRPNVGIGFDLTRLFGDGNRSKTIRNKEIDPFGS